MATFAYTDLEQRQEIVEVVAGLEMSCCTVDCCSVVKEAKHVLVGQWCLEMVAAHQDHKTVEEVNPKANLWLGSASMKQEKVKIFLEDCYC